MCRFEGLLPPTAPTHALLPEGPKVATGTADFRILGPLPDVAAIGADAPAATTPVWEIFLYLGAFCAILLDFCLNDRN